MNRGQRCGPLLLMFCGRCLCVSVSPLDITMSCVEIAEPIEMLFIWDVDFYGSWISKGKGNFGGFPAIWPFFKIR